MYICICILISHSIFRVTNWLKYQLQLLAGLHNEMPIQLVLSVFLFAYFIAYFSYFIYTCFPLPFNGTSVGPPVQPA